MRRWLLQLQRTSTGYMLSPRRREHLVLVRTVLCSLLAASVAGCSPRSEGGSSPVSSSADASGLPALLQECGSSQSTVLTALQGTDHEVILHTLASAHVACSLAATKLRETPIPTINSGEVAAGMDQMTAGLDKIAAAVRIMDQAPKRARATAQAGMKAYKAGLERVTKGQSGG